MLRKIFLAILILFVFVVVLVLISINYNGTLEPPQIVANFVDLNEVKQITKFRSCSGHTTVPQDGREMKRSMKHYIILFPERNKENTVKIYAPYDGYIALLFGEEEIWITPGKKSLLGFLPINRWMFSVTHVRPREGLKMGDSVEAGELIGYGTFSVSEKDTPTFDVVYGTMSIPPKKVDNWPSPYGNLDSIFNHMSSGVLEQYEQKGVTRENSIVSKEERDSDPCLYRGAGPYFEAKIVSDDRVDLKH